jgi:seryl-tRNA synthetase
MLDLKFISENAEFVKEVVKNKKEKANIDELLKLYENKKKLQFNFDNLKAEQNKVSKEIAKRKRNKENADDLLAQMKLEADKIKKINSDLSNASTKLEIALLQVPNIYNKNVPIGDSEDDNEIVRYEGSKKEFSFKPKTHIELAEINHLLDIERGTKLTGSGFPTYINKGAMLERALINFMLDFHILKHNYSELKVPFMVNRKTMTGTGQLPKLENDMYHIAEDDLFLIPTAEVPVTNFYSGEILSEKKLPVKFVSYTPCFRREAGSYGKDTKGLQRVHQFNKVEMVRLVKPEESYDILNEMVNDAEDILKALGLHYRVLNLCTGDLSFASAQTFDLEVWAPGAKKYLEVSSISNFEDFQARRASLRFRGNDGKPRFVHTLNGSGLATPRTFIAILETYQNEDGTIDIPEVLQPYLLGLKKI